MFRHVTEARRNKTEMKYIKVIEREVIEDKQEETR